MDGLISVDDHVIEPPDIWVDRVRAADRDRVPHVIEEHGASIWHYGDVRIPMPALFAQAGRDEEDIVPGLMTNTDMRAGYYDAATRTVDIDADGNLESLSIQNIPR